MTTIKTAPKTSGVGSLLSETQIIDRIFNHVDQGTTDLGDTVWREPVDNYFAKDRFDAELSLLRHHPIPYCPSAALTKIGSYQARKAAGTPLLVARGRDGKVRAFINACRHRGMQVASGNGCSKAFICPYHAWTYSLEGELRAIRGKEAFPDMDPSRNGLVEVSALEYGGIIYVQQEGKINPTALEGNLEYFSPEQQLFDQSETSNNANWKLITETLLEGYHIKSLHKDTFYPFGLDNVNLVEIYGANSRITFPFRRIEKLREVPSEQRKIDGMATTVNHIFPNASVSSLSKHASLTIMEPLTPSSTQMITFLMTSKHANESNISIEAAKKDAKFVSQSGQDEDIAAACSIQETVTAKANSHLTFGYFEKAIVNFHKHLTNNL